MNGMTPADPDERDRGSTPLQARRASDPAAASRASSRSATAAIGGGRFALDRRAVRGRDARADARDRAHVVARRRRRRCCAAAPTSRARARTPSRASARPACRSSPRRSAQTGLPVVTELMDVRDVEAVARGRRHDPDRRAQHAELRAADRGRAHALPGDDQARAVEHDRGAADGGRVRAEGGQRERRPVRARHPHVRDRLPLHARPRRGAGAQGAQPPAGASSTRATPPAGATSSSRWRWRRPRSAPTGSSSRSTPIPTARSATGRSRCAATTSRASPRASSRSPRSPASAARGGGLTHGARHRRRARVGRSRPPHRAGLVADDARRA